VHVALIERVPSFFISNIILQINFELILFISKTPFLKLLLKEAQKNNTISSAFSMPCFFINKLLFYYSTTIGGNSIINRVNSIYSKSVNIS